MTTHLIALTATYDGSRYLWTCCCGETSDQPAAKSTASLQGFMHQIGVTR